MQREVFDEDRVAFNVGARAAARQRRGEQPPFRQERRLRLTDQSVFVLTGIEQEESEDQKRVEVHGQDAQRRERADFRGDVLADLRNPQRGACDLACLPQFVPQGGDVFRWSMLFMTIELVIAITCLSGYAVLAQAAGRLLKRPTVMAWLERGLGGILIGLGLRVAL